MVKRTFLQDLIRVFQSNVIIILSGVCTSIVTARYIGPGGNGIMAGLAVYPSLFMTIGSLGIRQSTAYYLGKGIYPEDKIKTAITQIWMFTTVLSLVMCFVLIRHFSKSGDNLYWVILSLLPIPFNLFVTYNSGVFLGKNNIVAFNKVNWIPPVLILVMMLILVVTFDLNVSGALWAAAIGPFFMALLMLFRNNFLSAFSLKFDVGIIKSMLSLGIIYAFSLLIINLNYKADVILLDMLSNSYELGIYTKGANITEYLWQVPMLLSTIIFARSAVAEDEKAFSFKVAQLLRLSMIIIGFVAFSLFCVSDFLILTLYGEAFKESVMVLKSLLPGVVILTVYKVMNMDLAGKGKPWIAMIAMIPSLIINIVLNYIFIPKYGATGSALCSTVSYTIAGITFLFLYSKEVQIPILEILKYQKTDFDPIINLMQKVIKKK